jgi:NAD(P)-dependent dehydrogenase (short-subunit alcohol dehydrogenase family)
MSEQQMPTALKSDRRFDGRVALVSGAASGIGRAVAMRLAEEGATVICGDLQRDPVGGGLDGAIATDEVIRGSGGRAEFCEWDVTSPADCRRSLELAIDGYGRLDILVANAGVALEGLPLPDEKPETWQPQLEINLTGTWNSVRLGLRALIDQGTGGRIVTLSSIAGLVGIRSLASGYSVSKAGIIQLTRQAAVEGAPYGVTANAVCPGYVRTAINPGAWRDEKVEREIAGSHPLGRLGEAADVAGAVAFLASDDASWVTGVELPVDGGWTCV